MRGGWLASIGAASVLALATPGMAADAPNRVACLAKCSKDYDACWRAGATYQDYGECYRRANACSEACGRIND